MEALEARKPGQFSSPKMEEIFKHLHEVSNRNNILLKKNLVELVNHGRSEIEHEIIEREKAIAENEHAIAELKSANDGLKLLDQEVSKELERINQ